ncbi:MAG TPA: SDR family NAD(P)-dependent oxidoreductase [Parvibaculum sp.]|jgi:NAD(P)-dependent dehydrogenase (short-subunit alcohol dehydrogenase family)
MTDVKGRTAFITGGANGIGLGIAQVLAGAGAKLALADIDAAALERAKADLSALTTVETVVLDVRDRDAYVRAADDVERALGPVSLLFNNAGVAGGAAVDKLTYELWDWAIGINLIGVINGIQTFLPRMLARGSGGHIVNTASGAGLAATTSGVLYTTAKFGVVGMSEALNLELAAAGIGVSVLCPGPVATDIVTRTFENQPSAGLSSELRQKTMERLAQVTQFLKQGVSPEAVGAMVLEAINGDRLYIHTDRIMADAVPARAKAILAAMPTT